MNLRPYQAEAVDAIVSHLRTHRSTMIVLPTGTGKTQVFVSVIAKARGRCLVLAHRNELVQQAAARIFEVSDVVPGLEKAEDTATLADRVVVGSVQTLRGPRLASWPRDHFSLIVIDEAHHAIADSYVAIIEHFSSAKILGVTATPDRQDAAAMGRVFESVAYTYPLASAIVDGWLVRPVLRRVLLEEVNLSAVTVRAGDYATNELEDQIAAHDVIAKVGEAILEYGGGRILAYTPGVKSAHALAAAINGCQPGSARALDGTTPDDVRATILHDHEAGKYRVLCNCLVLTEGYDSPRVDTIAVARPTKSRALYAQMIGRGLRLADGKDHCLILDFVGATKRLDLVGPEDILGEGREEGTAKEVREKVEKEPGEVVDVLEQLELIEREIRYRIENAEEVVEKKIAKRGMSAADAWANAGYRREDFEIAAGMGGKPPTGKQWATIEKFGVSPAGLTFATASRLLDVLITRARAGLATPKQLRILLARGLGTAQTTREEAGKILDALASRKWRNHGS